MHDDELLAALSASLDDGDTPVDPTRIDAIRAAASNRSATASARPSRRVRRTALAVAAVATIVVGGAVAWTSLPDDEPAGTTEYAGPIAGPAGAGELSVVETGIGRVIEIDTEDLEILPTGEFYEVWFVGPGDATDSPNRISAGTFHPRPDGVTDVTLAAAVDPTKYPRVEITAEPGDGDPTPSDAVVLEVDLAD